MDFRRPKTKGINMLTEHQEINKSFKGAQRTNDHVRLVVLTSLCDLDIHLEGKGHISNFISVHRKNSVFYPW